MSLVGYECDCVDRCACFDDLSGSKARIVNVCDDIKSMLLAKNAAYGDSALEPMRVFSGADPVEQIKVRIDDKLSRLARGHSLPDEARRDTIRDLIGYLVLLLIAEGT